MNEIKILVAAQAGGGKSTIANQIVNILRCGGLDVDLLDRDHPSLDPEPRMPIMKCAERFANMVAGKQHHITVETRQVKRDVSVDHVGIEMRLSCKCECHGTKNDTSESPCNCGDKSKE